MQTYSVGFARLDITPLLGVRMVDLGKDVCGTGVLEPLHVTALAFGDGEQGALMLSLDTHQVSSPYSEQWPPRIAEALGLNADSVFFCCSHSHPTPCVNADEEYAAWLYRRMVDAGAMALKDRKLVVDVLWAQERAEGMAFTRRYRMQNGTVETNPVRAEGKMVGPAAPCDDTMRVVRFVRQDADEIVLVNCQAHPGNGSSLEYSAEYPGIVCRMMERKVDGLRCVYVNGAEGEMITRGPKPFVKNREWEFSQEYSAKMTEIALRLREKAVPTNMEGLRFGKKIVTAKTKRDPSRYEEALRILEIFRTKPLADVHPNPKTALCMAGEAGQIVRLERAQMDYTEIAITAITFCGVALTGISGEPFSAVAVDLRQASPYPATCVCCLANGSKGYMPTAEAFDQGGYETFNTPLVKGVAEQVTEAAIQLLQEL